MSHKIYKFIALTVFTLFLTFIIMSGIILSANFHRYYPDETLKIGEEVTAFFNRITLPIKIAYLSRLPADTEILIPVYEVRLAQISNTWQAPRPDARSHEGQDIFADKGTPVFSGVNGYVTRIGFGDLGGNFVNVTGAGGRRYYYAHLDKVAEGLYRGQAVTTDTVLGFVGNTGNAANTPPHLHFGVYASRKAINPLPYLVNRPR